MEESQKNKKPLLATISEYLMLISFLIISSRYFAENDLDSVMPWTLVPLGFGLLSIFYRISQIGAGIVAIIEYLDVGGMPIIGMLILLAICIFFYITREKIILELIKYFAGFVSGAFIQKKITKTS